MPFFELGSTVLIFQVVVLRKLSALCPAISRDANYYITRIFREEVRPAGELRTFRAAWPLFYLFRNSCSFRKAEKARHLANGDPRKHRALGGLPE